MSDESEQEPKNKLTDNTWVPLGKVALIACSLVSASWLVSGAIHDLKGTIDELKRDRWTATDMERWAVLLERANRTGTPPLSVPDVREIQSLTRKLEK